MVKRARIELGDAKVGDNVAIPIPAVDRGRGDPRNLLGVVVDRDDHMMHIIATSKGTLKGKYSRNQFLLCPEKLLQIEDMDREKLISLREAVTMTSSCGGQGYSKCTCAGQKRCQTRKCTCFRNNRKCNSRCHQSLSCKNK